MIITSEYFREYRKLLGFTNQSDAKAFFAGKDITPTVDYNYIDLLNKRLEEIFIKLNDLMVDELQVDNIEGFCSKNIHEVFQKLKENNIIKSLNNQGRRPEQVYFSWMRGYIISNYFLKAIGYVFDIHTDNIELIGDDDLVNIETFKRTPKADLELILKNGIKARIEVQSGFVGINDIKQHKVLEAKKVFNEKGIPSYAMHIDLFNGQVAFVRLDNIEDTNIHWITRQQMEGQTVFNIDPNFFNWKITELPNKFIDLNIE